MITRIDRLTRGFGGFQGIEMPFIDRLLRRGAAGLRAVAKWPSPNRWVWAGQRPADARRPAPNPANRLSGILWRGASWQRISLSFLFSREPHHNRRVNHLSFRSRWRQATRGRMPKAAVAPARARRHAASRWGPPDKMRLSRRLGRESTYGGCQANRWRFAKISPPQTGPFALQRTGAFRRK
jgi:hypothetical protein